MKKYKHCFNLLLNKHSDDILTGIKRQLVHMKTYSFKEKYLFNNNNVIHSPNVIRNIVGNRSSKIEKGKKKYVTMYFCTLA